MVAQRREGLEPSFLQQPRLASLSEKMGRVGAVSYHCDEVSEDEVSNHRPD